MDTTTANKLEYILSGYNVSMEDRDSLIDLMDEYASQFQQEWIPVEVIREVLNKRIAEFISIHHTYEARELESALNTILRLVPRQPYNPKQP